MTIRLIVICCVAAFLSLEGEEQWSRRIADSFIALHPDSIVYPDEEKSKKWNYEQGLMMEAFYQMWRHSGDDRYRAYMKKNLDHYIGTDGSITTYSLTEFNIDNITPGKAALRMYDLTKETKYKIVADSIRKQLSLHPRTLSGGFWHKKIYPNQMWLDGLYMAEPFYMLYSTMFNDTAAFDDIAHQILLIASKTFDPKTGLYFHGWDESRKQRWADPVTGCSPNLWGRSLGWYAMAIVDVLDQFPEQHPKRKELLSLFQRFMENILKQRDTKSNTWYQIVNEHERKGNYLEASASAMFTYAFAKGVNKKYLPALFASAARESFDGLIQQFVRERNGKIFLHDVVKVGGLGGKPYRDGSFEYYISEPKRVNDFKGYGPLLLAAIEIEKMEKKNEISVGLDYYYNSEWKKIDGSEVRFHYTWEDTMDSGFSMFGTILKNEGAKLYRMQSAPTHEMLSLYDIYIIVDPDTPKETAKPNYIQEDAANVIEQWVRRGGILVLMGNDKGNAEFEHFNKLAVRFGIRFNEDMHQDVVNNRYDSGRVTIFPEHPMFNGVHSVFIKQFSSLSVAPPANEVLKTRGAVVIAQATIGRGMVVAIGDPWFYNEYMDNRRVPPGYENATAAKSFARWLCAQAKLNRKQTW
ncbi:MAG: glycoside hydrolase family 88 protein [Bacteroidota bacterium]